MLFVVLLAVGRAAAARCLHRVFPADSVRIATGVWLRAAEVAVPGYDGLTAPGQLEGCPGGTSTADDRRCVHW